MATEKTLWKKNLDSNFVSGEDLKNSFNGLKPEIICRISRFLDAETFDQNKQSKQVITGLFLTEIGGKELYKPVILNKTNAKFFIKETGSEFIDDWIGHTVIMWAMPDKRHGHVVRFKTYAKQALEIGSKNFEACRNAYLKDAKILDAIKKKYNVTAEIETALTAKEAKNG